MKRSDALMIVRAISRRMKAELSKRDERIASLELQIKAMPTGLNYRGPYRDGDEFSKGDIVTFRGSMWYCKQATASRPGESQSSAWVLCVKAGRDARR